MADPNSLLLPFGALTGQRQPRVLVVDDSEQNRELLSRRLARLGCDVREAASGEQALGMLAEADAVLLDVNMPEMSGLECLRQIRRSYDTEALPVIMVTARDQSSMVVECLEVGASDYVTKPVDFPVLAARLRTWLRVKQLNDERAQFMRIAGHDLRNPLAQILGAAELVVESSSAGAPLSDKHHRFLRGILNAGQRMRYILSDLVDAQMIDGGVGVLQASEFELSSLLAAAVERSAAAASGKGISLRLGAMQPVLVRADPDRMDQVFDNLLSNAVKFSLPGTSVVVSCRASSDTARVEVRDEGPGLSEDDARRAFQRYARLSPKPTGGETSTGLGLWISRLIVEQHGGRIGVLANRPERGSTFWLWLPAAGAPA